ncbi:MAG TPA: TIGR01777 family protein [Caldithrix abyssi]|uniref:TIGR01777 family protein n=1 Tax=Caldithrix abyssi TaxID=187145 RepID=A0A7V4U3M0_CALAY|nr:TIGR01777 family protein [Caldithrix abyssi]
MNTKKTVLITGGSGLIGRKLTSELQKNGFRVSWLSRKDISVPDVHVYKWNIERNVIDRKAIEAAHVIVHLAGANIGARRWTKKRKQTIIDSRIKSAELLLTALRESGKTLDVFVSASAVGYYGARTTEKVYSEEDSAADDFLGSTCRKWEEAANRFTHASDRLVKLRTGVVLDAREGALPKMALPVKLGFGSSLGSGKQYIPWIHIDDIVGIYLKAIEDKAMQGAFNAVAPQVVTLDEFLRTLARVLKRPYFMPRVPAIVLKILLGEMSRLILEGSRISADKVQKAGYKFKFDTVDNALARIYG